MVGAPYFIRILVDKVLVVEVLAMEWIEDFPHEESEDLVDEEDAEQFGLLSCRPGKTDTVRISKREDDACIRINDFDQPLYVKNGYGVRTNGWHRLDSQGRMQVSSSNQDRNRRFVPRRETGRHQNSLSPSFSNQRNAGAFQGSFSSKMMAISQSSKNTDQFEISRKYGPLDNDETSDDRTRGSKAYMFKNPSAPSPLKGNLGRLIHRDQYNKSDFQIKYEFAKFFIIKALSEDDIHKSIKYNVWSSTPFGNKKLDVAYWNAEEMVKEKSSKCPIFLFFSVNGSGRFLGLAEMDGPVDFDKDMNFWQEEKWNGFFPVKWRIVKDIPNRHFQSIRLENNYNRLVTHSRDTQEIWLPHGLEMLSIFRSYPASTSLLDDFEFYEKNERVMRNTRAKCHSASRQEVDLNDHGSSMTNLEAQVKRVNLSQKATLS